MDEIDYCLDFLENNEDYVSAKGRFLWIQRKNKDTKRLSEPDRMRFKHLPMYSFTEFVDERHIVVICSIIIATCFFSVMRGDAFLSALEQVPRYFPTTGWLDQFAFTIVCGVCGKSHTSARLYCVRQAHPAQGQHPTQAADQYRHWPMLLASPDFSDNCQSFRQCLIDSCREFVSASDELLTSVIDEGLVTLIQRGCGVRPPLESQEHELISQLKDSSSRDHKRMRQVIQNV